jgi:two-component system response regulator RegA
MIDVVACHSMSSAVQRMNEMLEFSATEVQTDRTLLLVDDDEAFVKRLARALEKRGFLPQTAQTVAAGLDIALSRPPAYAVVDLRLEDGSGLDVVEALRERRPDCRIVVLTGYGAIATAVASLKIGATDYLAKPADADDVTNALLSQTNTRPRPPKIRCLPIRSGGNTFNASTSCVIATFRKRHVG